MTRWIGAAAVSIACAVLIPVARGASLAPDGVDLTFGQGDNVFVSGAGLNWSSLCECRDLKSYGFDTRLEAQLTHWHAQVHPTEHGSLWDVGLTPMLRWLVPGAPAVQPFVELGVGVHLLSHTRINNERVLSTAFQFGENGGAGIRFGEHHRFELGVYVQHESNARIKEPNSGLTYFGGVLRVAFP
ncbi:MAG TPA: acyloxyacyl hydrolase [Casimicrobiaceae bacterium]|nr:acyloxyacyl hydrolase [Casimicrobiaceae bacterium]